MLANGKILVPLPMEVFPSMWTFEINSTSSSSLTFGPT